VLDGRRLTAAQALGQPAVTLAAVRDAGYALEASVDHEHLDASSIEAEFRYRGYLRQHEAQYARTQASEMRRIPRDFEYSGVPGLSREVIERLSMVRPETVGQASRVPGVTPAAVAIVAARLSKRAAVNDGASSD
jgi:tRNA uridine 5-carboxymethylaminomethyl modification enzyme